MRMVNKRPIGMNDTLDSVRPCDIIPVWSSIQPRTTMMGATRVIQEAQEEFQRKWSELYKTSITKQRKWLQSNHDLKIGDLVYRVSQKNETPSFPYTSVRIHAKVLCFRCAVR